VAAAGIAGAAVIFGADRLSENDRALLAQALDEDVVARRKIDVVGRVAARRRPHVLCVERIFEGEDDPVHRQFVDRRVAAIARVERSGGLERVREAAELVANRRRAKRQGTKGRVTVELALAGDRALAANVQGRERVELAGIGLPRDHAVLLLYIRIGGSRLHAAKFEGWTLVFVAIGEDRRGGDGLGREAQWGAGANRPGGFGNACAVLGDEQAGDAIIGAGARNVLLDHLYDRRLAGPDRGMQVVDRRLFEAKRLLLRVGHDLAPRWCAGVIIGSARRRVFPAVIRRSA
jgi:hypothetical protein